MIFTTGISVSHFLCAQGVGDLRIKKLSRVWPGGKWSGLELTDTL